MSDAGDGPKGKIVPVDNRAIARRLIVDKLLAQFAWVRLPAEIISVTTQAVRSGKNLVWTVQFSTGLACGTLVCRLLVPLSGILSVITTVILMFAVMMAMALGFTLIPVGGRLTTKKRVLLDEARRIFEEATDALDKEARSLRASGMSDPQINNELLPRRRLVTDQYLTKLERIDGDDGAIAALAEHADAAKRSYRTATEAQPPHHDVGLQGLAAGEESSRRRDELTT